MEAFLKLFLLVYYSLFFLLAIVLPTARVWMTTENNPFRIGLSDSAHDYVGKNFIFVMFICGLVIFIFTLLPSVYPLLVPIPYLSHDAFVWSGIILLVLAMIWIPLAQTQMQKSWRIGIDEDVKTELVYRGLFKVSRNPIFLGMRIMLLGLFFILPNAVMLATWIAGELLVQVQVRLEEEFLTRIHGESYLAYRKQVRRWI